MSYRVDIKMSARRELEALARRDRARVDAAILALSEDPRPRGCAKMAGAADLWRIRVGDYRMVYTVRDDVLVVMIVKVGHRREVYRRR